VTGRLAPVIAAAAVSIALAACAPSASSLDRTWDDAQHLMRRGRVDEALVLAQRGAEQAGRAGDVARTWRFRLLAADAHLTRLEFPAAMAVLEEPVPDGAALAALRGRQLYLLARARVAQGQLAAAAPLVAEARPLAAGDAALRLELELLESQLLYRTGRAPDADVLLQSARTRVAAEGDPYRLAQVSNTMGMGLVTRGRYDEALPYFDSIVRESAIAGTTVQGLAFNNAGLCYARLGQFDRAVSMQQQAIAIQQGGRRQSLAQALGELGSTYLLQDDLAKGAEYIQQAFSIAAEAGLASDAALFARNLSAAYIALGRWDEAAHFNEEAARFAAGAPSPYAIVTEAQVAEGRGRRDEARRLFQRAVEAEDATPGVRWMSSDGLARLAVAEGRAADAAKHFEAALRTVEETRSALLRADYRISFTSRLIGFYDRYVDFLVSQGQVERALEVADSSRGRVLAERQGLAAPQVRTKAATLQALARRTHNALVFYRLGPERSRAWTVTAGRITVHDLPPASEIEALVAAHQSAIQSALADSLAAAGSPGERLYAAVLEPIRPMLPAQVVVVPDGALHRVNFETLVVPAPARHYLIDDLAIQVAPSLAMLEAAPRRGPGGPLLLVGNATPRPPEFPALGYAPAEMAGIKARFPGPDTAVLEGAQASPAAFRAADPGRFSVIHFTSHAVANLESPLDSAVILSGPGDAYKLYARDVAALPLHAELVTVSACRSAGERAYAGEGLVGFAWAFLRAGSRRVVAGLWDVDDRSTAALMDDMYARIAAGAAPAVALRDAKRALMRAGYPKPYFWAPFQVFTVVI